MNIVWNATMMFTHDCSILYFCTKSVTSKSDRIPIMSSKLPKSMNLDLCAFTVCLQLSPRVYNKSPQSALSAVYLDQQSGIILPFCNWTRMRSWERASQNYFPSYFDDIMITPTVLFVLSILISRYHVAFWLAGLNQNEGFEKDIIMNWAMICCLLRN